MLDLSREKDAEVLARIATGFDPEQRFNAATLLEPREAMLRRSEDTPVLTDDNMRVEWERALRE